MSQNGLVRSMKPSTWRLYESSVCLTSCLNSHREAQCTDHCKNESTHNGTTGETPTLAALARHYRLGQLLKVIAPLVVLQERLYQRLEKRPNIDELAKRSFPSLFQILEDESKTVLQVSQTFSSDKEHRFTMETNINIIRDSLNEILDALQAVHESKYDSPGCLSNKMAEIVDELLVEWSTVQAMRENLPERYSVNYGSTLEKTSL
ncbi:uncharacterized protein LOC117298724 isoform X2 [Asterias rubens]|nr:uncharacterized protein LOC117298724 isoform X2 [Asterias rubens]